MANFFENLLRGSISALFCIGNILFHLDSLYDSEKPSVNFFIGHRLSLSEMVEGASERTNERSRARKRSVQCGISDRCEQMSKWRSESSYSTRRFHINSTQCAIVWRRRNAESRRVWRGRRVFGGRRKERLMNDADDGAAVDGDANHHRHVLVLILTHVTVTVETGKLGWGLWQDRHRIAGKRECEVRARRNSTK